MTHQHASAAPIAMTLVITVLSLAQCGIRPSWLIPCAIDPSFNCRPRKLRKDNWVLLLHDLNNIPRTHFPSDCRVLCNIHYLAPQKWAEPIMVYSILSLMFPCSPFIFLLLTDPFFLSTFWARELCNGVLVTFITIVFELDFYALLLIINYTSFDLE